MSWVCCDCTTTFAVGLAACPHCGSTDCYEQGDESMAKITVHGGPSNAAAAVVAAVVAAVADDSSAEVGEDQAAEEPEGAPVDPDPYADWSLAELQEEAAARGLAKSGTKADLVRRLTDDDNQSGGPEEAGEGVVEVEPAF